ncbi:MAG: hypothetical protein AB7G39_13115 [Alphaproteobacteria bacterium]
MTRLLLSVLLPLVTPIAVFLLYQWYDRKWGRARDLENRKRTPWEWLVVAGAVLAGASLVVFWVLGEGGARTDTYVPPVWDGQRIVPGHFER